MTDHEIFRLCFPEYRIAEHIFSHNALEGRKALRCEGGFATVRRDRIELLCVAPEYGGQGRGKALLERCEARIAENGYRTVSIGGGLICGAEERSVPFFEKMGYAIGECSYTEMELKLADFIPTEAKLNCDVDFGFYDGDIDELRRAVSCVDEEWVQYFTEGQMFFCGYVAGELASFCIVGDDEQCLLSDGVAKIGSVGCVGTLPEFRNRGMGLRMVALASEWLKRQGCDKVFIHYTHLDGWYGRLGAKVFQRFRTAEKKL